MFPAPTLCWSAKRLDRWPKWSFEEGGSDRVNTVPDGTSYALSQVSHLPMAQGIRHLC